MTTGNHPTILRALEQADGLSPGMTIYIWIVHDRYSVTYTVLGQPLETATPFMTKIFKITAGYVL